MTEQMNSTDDAERIVNSFLKDFSLEIKEVRAICSPKYKGGFNITISVDSPLKNMWAEKIANSITDIFNSFPDYTFVGSLWDSYMRSDGTGSLTYTTTILSRQQGDELCNEIEFIEMFHDFLKDNKIDSIVIGETGGLSFRGKDLEINVCKGAKIITPEQLEETAYGLTQEVKGNY